MHAAALTTKTVLTLKQPPHVPLDAEVLTPDVLAPLAHDEVRALPVVLGCAEAAGAGSAGTTALGGADGAPASPEIALVPRHAM